MYTFVSVVFDAEFPLLVLQARSMARYLPPAVAAELVVIDNSVKGMSEAQRAELLAAYGPLAARVRILRPDDICRVPGTLGWRSQQVLKLCVAAQVQTDRYVVLDAKNHFVATPDEWFFEAPDGRIRVNVYSFVDHPLRADLERVLSYLGLEPSAWLDRFTATVTPFVLDTATVRTLVLDIERRSGRSFAREFVTQGLTEFFLYTGWIIADGQALEDVFDFHQVFCPVVWPGKSDQEGVSRTIAAASNGAAPIFAVHRNAFARLDGTSRTILSSFWAERGLFSSTEEGEAFVGEFTSRLAGLRRAQQIRDLRHRFASLPARVRRRLTAHRAQSRGI